jgi:N-acyl-D-amino-acid deacylase
VSIEYLLKDGIVIDGSSPVVSPKKMDIAVDGGRIKEIGQLSHLNAERTVSLDGMIVCPGFIDAHGHSEFALLADGRAEGKISQGITTEVNGNCGLSAAPLEGAACEQRESDLEELNITDRWSTFSQYFLLLEKRGFAVNFMTLTGHGNLRASVMGYEDKVPTEAEMKKMTALLRTAMEEGAKGLSTGLIYPPGIYAATSELIDLSREAARFNGIYATHMRSEGDDLLASVDEVMQIAEKTGIPAHISHLKTSGKKNWKKLDQVFNMLEAACEKGLSVSCDRYPYIASSTDLDAILPAWAFEGGHRKEIERLKHQREKLADAVLRDYAESSDWDKVVVSSVNTDINKWMEGKSISEISRSQNRRELDCFFDVLIEEELHVGAIFFSMNEDNLKSILKRGDCVIGTDSAARSFSGITARGVPHPRGFGTFPRVLGRYVRELGVLSLPEAVYKMTGLPARIFNIQGRGMIRKGFFADITVFKPDKVIDSADYAKPFQKPEGIHHVFVNGTPAVFEGEITGELPGRILR